MHRPYLRIVTPLTFVLAAACAEPPVESSSAYATSRAEPHQLRGRTARDLLSALQYVDEALAGDLGRSGLVLDTRRSEWKGESYRSWSVLAGDRELLKCSEPDVPEPYARRVGCQLYDVTTDSGHQITSVSGGEATGAAALAAVLEAVPADLPGLACSETPGGATCSVDHEAWLEVDYDLSVFDALGVPTVHVEGELAEEVFELLATSGDVDHDGEASEVDELWVGTVYCGRAPGPFCELGSDEIRYDLFTEARRVSFTNALVSAEPVASDILFDAMQRLAEEGSPIVVDHDVEDGFAYSAGGWSCSRYLDRAPVCDVE